MDRPNRHKLLRINTLTGSYKGRWEEIRVPLPLPPRRCFHSACLFENKLIVYGGQDLSECFYSDLWVFTLDSSNTANEKWQSVIAHGEAPGCLSRHSALIHAGQMIVFGGTDGVNESNIVYMLDLNTFYWRRVEGSVPAIDSHSAVLVGSQMLVFGGYVGGDITNDLHIFDVGSLSWRKQDTESPPEPRADHTGVLHGEYMWVYGGKGVDSHLSDLWKLSLNTFAWQQVSFTGNSPGTVSGHSALVYGDVMLIFGGFRDILKETNEMYTYDYENNYWALIQTEVQIEDPVTPAEVDNFNRKLKKTEHLDPGKNILYNGPPSPMQGRIEGKIPHSRDGHSATLFENLMIIFGGDRHQMSFNDLYCYSVHEKKTK